MQQGDPRIELRLRIAAVVMLLVFALFTLRLFQLQFIRGAALFERSQQNSVRSQRVIAPRGELLDREGRVLATLRPAYQLRVTPSAVQNPRVTFRTLAHLLADGESAESLRKKVGAGGGARRFEPVLLRDDLPFQTLARIETHAFALPGVHINAEPRRFYPGGAAGAHLFGRLGQISPQQLDAEQYAGFQARDIIGQAGLEQRFNAHLQGTAGGRNVVVDVAGRVVEVLDEIPPVRGGRVVLALDRDLQEVAEAAFLDVPEGEPPKMGAAIALDVRNGDVLALVSLPSYDPNDFAHSIARESWRALVSDPWQPLRNRAIQNHYPPGSIHKAIVAAALLEEGVIDKNSSSYCPGKYRYGRRDYRCWKRGGHGNVKLRDALKRSCDVFFYRFGVELGVDRLARHAASFGLGRKSGIALPHEVAGLVPSSAWKQRARGEAWLPGETVSSAIGQGFNLYTPLQLAVAYAALAGGGEVLRPRLALRLEDENGALLETFAREVTGRVTVAPEHLARVRAGLVAVVAERGGTGWRARVAGVSVGGKTGTAQVVELSHHEGLSEAEIPVRERDHGWFGAFAPAEAPEIAVSVFAEHGLHGSDAAPIAQKILARYFQKKAAREEAAELAATAARERAAAFTAAMHAGGGGGDGGGDGDGDSATQSPTAARDSDGGGDGDGGDGDGATRSPTATAARGGGGGGGATRSPATTAATASSASASSASASPTATATASASSTPSPSPTSPEGDGFVGD